MSTLEDKEVKTNPPSILSLLLTCLRESISSAHDSCRNHCSKRVPASPLAKANNQFTSYRGTENVLSLQEQDRNQRSLIKHMKISLYFGNLFCINPWTTADGQVLSKQLHALGSHPDDASPKNGQLLPTQTDTMQI